MCKDTHHHYKLWVSPTEISNTVLKRLISSCHKFGCDLKGSGNKSGHYLFALCVNLTLIDAPEHSFPFDKFSLSKCVSFQSHNIVTIKAVIRCRWLIGIILECSVLQLHNIF